MKALFIAALLTLSSVSWAQSVSVDNAYVRHMPPTQANTGAFMTIKNHSTADRAVVSAESDVAKTVELHTHIHDNGVMRMRQVEKIEVPGGGETVLKPGGLHVMLIDLVAPLALDQQVAITLNMDDGSQQQVLAPVKSVMAGMKMKPEGGMDHGTMKHEGKHDNTGQAKPMKMAQ